MLTRPAEALAWLDRAPDRHESEEVRHTDLRITALDALKRQEEAQALRWEAFRRWLTPQHLRPYLRALPGFDDVEVEEGAVAHALAHPDRNLALAFLAGWPDPAATTLLHRALAEDVLWRASSLQSPASRPMKAFLARLGREHDRETECSTLLGDQG